MSLQFHRAVAGMEVWSAASGGLSFRDPLMRNRQPVADFTVPFFESKTANRLPCGIVGQANPSIMGTALVLGTFAVAEFNLFRPPVIVPEAQIRDPGLCRSVVIFSIFPLAYNYLLWGSDSSGAMPYARLRTLLRKFDARMNHRILGKKWAIRDYDRIWAFWFLEKPNANPLTGTD